MRKFEWDNDKYQINIEKHKLSFEMAKLLFENPLSVTQDTRFNLYDGEDRYIGLGELDGRLMVVVFTIRKPGRIRIISFRKANKREQKEYYKN